MELTDDTANRLRIEFHTEPVGVLKTLDKTLSGATQIELNNVLPGGVEKRWLYFFTITAPDVVDLSTALAEVEYVELVSVKSASSMSDTFYVLTFTDGHELRPTRILLEYDAIPHGIAVQNHTMNIVASVTDWQKLKMLAEGIERQQGVFELVGVTETNEMSFPLGGSTVKYSLQGALTAEQLAVIETAYQCGYFEVPKQATADEIAQELDVSQSTLSEQLRNAQNAVWNILFGDRLE